MAIKELKAPKLSYGWLADGWETTTNKVNNWGRLLAISVNSQHNIAYWRNIGAQVSVNNGVTAPAPGFVDPAGLVADDVCRFVGAQVLASGQIPADPNRPINNWTQENADASANWSATYRQGKVITDSIDEDYTGNGSVSSIYNSALFYMVCVAWGKLYKAANMLYFMTYAGVCYITKGSDPNFDNALDFVGSLDDPQTALNGLRPGGQHNHRSTPVWDADTVQKPNMFRWCHALVNCYYASASKIGNPNARLAEFICNMIITRNGLTALGYTTAVKICSFFWLSNTEFSYWQARVKRDVPAGGTVESDNFPNYSFVWQLACLLYAKILTEVIYLWDNEKAYGKNQNKVPNDFGTPGNSYIHYTGSGATRADTASATYLDSQPEFCYPIKPLGYDNAAVVANQWFDDCCTWVGNANWEVCPFRATNSGTPNAWSSTLKSSIVRQFKAKLPHGYRVKSSDGKRAVIGYNFSDVDLQTDIDLDGSIQTVTLIANTPFAFIAQN